MKDEFQTQMTSLLTSISHRKEIVPIGEFNARIGSQKKDPIIFGENIINDNRSTKDICETHNLRALNVFFQHRDFQDNLNL